MPRREFSPGFRLSMIDIVVLIAATAVVILLLGSYTWISGVVAFVLAHFFLFCNIIRMSRPLELLWAGIFVLLAAGTMLYSLPGWPLTYLLSAIVTVIVSTVEMRKPSYHGVLWQRINPTLRQWWENRK